MGMANCDLPDQIARLEVDIEQLAETLERCRKAMLVAKVAIGAGAIWILAYAIGVVMFGPPTMIGAIAAVIGGVVLYGSNSRITATLVTLLRSNWSQAVSAVASCR